MCRVTIWVWQQRHRQVSRFDAMVVRVCCRSLELSENQLSGIIPSTLGSLAALM